MSRNCCSLCGVAGHNRRNQRVCRVNVEQRAARIARHTVGALAPRAAAPATARAVTAAASVELIDANANIIYSHLLDARTQMNDLAQYLAEPPASIDFRTYILAGMTKVENTCRILTLVLRSDRHNIADISSLLFRLRAAASIFNIFIATELPTANVSVEIQEEYQTVRMVVDCERTQKSTFMKNIAIVQDLTITPEDSARDCPICYETVAPMETVYTNCRHSFCVTCIKGLATSVKNVKPCCPMCRQEITTMNAGSLVVCNEVKNHLTSI